MASIVDRNAILTDIDVQMIEVGGQQLQVAIKRGPKGRPPLLMFNGIGANWELAKPFLTALKQTGAIIFDIPGVGGSPLPSLPYRPSTLARLAMGLVEKLRHEQVDVAGVSWGGALAQQFAHQYDKACRKLVLATPRRYFDKGFMREIASNIYGGDFRKDPQLIVKYAQAMSGANGLGYFYQLLAMTGWTSLPWLWSLKQPTLVMAGTDDPIVPLVNGRILARLIPNARLETIDDGHLFMVTRPDETAAIIEAFLAE